MEKDQVTLNVKSGWKLYQIVAGIVAIAAMVFMISELVNIMEYAGAGAIFLVAFFALCSVGILYSIGYAFKHRLIFDKSGMRRKGVIKEKKIPYEEISEFRFSNSYWKMNPVAKVLGNSSAILIDFMYENPEKAKAFLKEVLSSEKGTKLVEE